MKDIRKFVNGFSDKSFLAISIDDSSELTTSLYEDPVYTDQFNIDLSAGEDPERESVEDKYKFRHLVLTDGVYMHPSYGLVNYDLDKLKTIVKNHYNKVSKERPFVRIGHANPCSFDEGAAMGWIFQDEKGLYIVKFNVQNNDGTSSERYGLIMEGYYTPEGYEKAVVNKAYKYFSCEIYNNYIERELPLSKEDLPTNEDGEVDFESVQEQWGSDEKGYGPTISAVSLTNTPFFHLPPIDESTIGEMSFIEHIDEEDLANHFSKEMFSVISKYSHLQSFEIHANNKESKLNLVKYNNGVIVVPEELMPHNFSIKKLYSLMEDEVELPKIGLIEKETIMENKEEEKFELPAEDAGEETSSEDEETPEVETNTEEVDETEVNAEVDTEETEEEEAEEINQFSLFDMSLEELEHYSGDKTSPLYQKAVLFAKQAREVELERQRAAQAKAQYQKALKEREEEIARYKSEVEQNKQLAFSERVERFTEGLHTQGYPTSLVNEVKSLFEDLDVSQRDSKFTFTNAVEDKTEELSFFSLVERIVLSVDPSVFKTNSEEVIINENNNSEKVHDTNGPSKFQRRNALLELIEQNK